MLRSQESRGGRIFRFHWIVSAALVCGLMLSSANAVAQERGVQFAVEPGPGSETDPAGGYFVIKAEPGQRVRQSVTLRNESSRSIELQLAAVDATTGQLGGVSYGLPDDEVEKTGAWITLSRSKVSFEPGEARSVTFEVSVPPDAGSGEHIAGIAVWEPGDEKGKKGDQPVSVVVRTRRVMAVQVDVGGAKVPELVVTGIDPAARPDGLYLEIGIENRGSAMTTGDGTVEISNQDFVSDFFVDTFVPGTRIGYPVKWTDDPREGTYDARVEISYEGKVAEWSGTFTIGDPLLADLEDRGVEVADGFPIVPVGAAAGAIAALAAGWWTVRSRRRRTEPADGAVGWTGPSGVSAPGSPATVATPPGEAASPRRGGPPPPPPPLRPPGTTD
ncbi:MAG: DUF916 domain-containing protein [Actinomycetota bacterium]|nr:DUF916 domain-containing protein [Actinomycetota bacterium]